MYLLSIDDDPLNLQDNEYDYIFHLASIARTNECLDDGLNLAYKSNVELTRLLLDNFKFKNFIYTSSCAIYGNQKTLPITEDNHPNPPRFIGVGSVSTLKKFPFKSEYSTLTSAELTKEYPISGLK